MTARTTSSDNRRLPGVATDTARRTDQRGRAVLNLIAAARVSPGESSGTTGGPYAGAPRTVIHLEVSMFEEILGLPVHVLVVHAVVVIVPLLAVLAIGYVGLPRWRHRLDWALGILAVVAPVTAFVAVESGEAFTDALVARGYQGQILDQIFEHSRYGDILFRIVVPLGIVAIALLVATSGHPRVPRLPALVTPVLAVATVALAIAALVYVYLTGHSGAEAVWGTTL